MIPTDAPSPPSGISRRARSLDGLLKSAKNSRERVIFAIGESLAGKTSFLKSAVGELGFDYFPLGLQLARRLGDVPVRRRPIFVERLLADLVDFSRNIPLCLDNTELLFEPSLRCDPVRLAQNLSRTRTLIFSLNGSFQGGKFVHGHPDHPEYFTADLGSCPVVSLADGDVDFQQVP